MTDTPPHQHNFRPLDLEGYQCTGCEINITDEEMARMNTRFRENLEQGIAQ